MGYQALMDGSSPEPSVPAIVEAISSRTEPETDRLATMLRSSCWPGGGSDRRVPGAIEWLRRWGPNGKGNPPVACSCAAGRCFVCN
jgi:hypothetical protein